MPEFDETTGFIMGGSEFYGHGNQKRKNGMPYDASPVKDNGDDKMNIGANLKKKYGGTPQTTDKEGKKIYGDPLIVHKYTEAGDPTKDWVGHGPGRGDLKEGYPKKIQLTQEERSEWVQEDQAE